jgi:hypothetical protein
LAFYNSTVGRGVKTTEKPVKEAKGGGAALVDGARRRHHVGVGGLRHRHAGASSTVALPLRLGRQ